MRLLHLVTAMLLMLFSIAVAARQVTPGEAIARATQRLNTIQTIVTNQTTHANIEVQNRVNAVTSIPVTPSAQPQQATPEQKAFIIGKITDFMNHVGSQELLYSRLAVGATVAAACFALLGAILSFIRQHIGGGIAGLIVTAILGISNAYPLAALSDFYTGLDAQTSALKVDAELKQPFTLDSYNAAALQLKALILAEGEKRPRLGSGKVATQELSNLLQTVKTSSETVEKTKGQM